MLLLACTEHNILSRWSNALADTKNIIVSANLNQLRNKLHNLGGVTVILHSTLAGIKSDNNIYKLLHDFPNAGFLVLADAPNEFQGVELVRNGALGYANTYIKPDVLHEAVKVIELGELWVSKRLLEWLVNHCHVVEHHKNEIGTYMALDSLTKSEKHVIEHLAEGSKNKEIANKLNITERTVKAHLTSIYSKTGVKDRLHLALLVHNYCTN